MAAALWGPRFHHFQGRFTQIYGLAPFWFKVSRYSSWAGWLPVVQSVLTPLISGPPAHLKPRAHPCGAVENTVLAPHKRGFRENLLGRESATVCVEWVEGRREGRPGRLGPRKSRWMTKPASLRQVLLTRSERFRGIDGLLNTTTVSCSSPPLLMYAGARQGRGFWPIW